MKSNGRCTGFVVDEHIIATAAHSVYRKSTDPVNPSGPLTINNISLFDSEGNREMTATPVEYHVLSRYVGTSDSYNANYDYALITVEEDLSDYMCFNLGAMLDNFATTNTEIYITGFPGLVMNEEGNLVAANGMYTGEGYLVSDSDYPNNYKIAYTNDTTGGNSGGPIYIEESRGNYSYNTAIAILFSGSTNENGEEVGNIGLRFTADHLHFYRNNPNINYE